MFEGTDFPSSLPLIEGEKAAENPSDEINRIDGEGNSTTVPVQPADLSENLVETAEPTQIENAGDDSEDNVATGVLGQNEESKGQRERLSSALSSGDENKVENPSEERNMLDGEGSGTAVSVQLEDLSRNLVETEEPTQMENVGNSSDHSEDNVVTGVFGETEESKGQGEHLSTALSSQEVNRTENLSDERDMLDGEASGTTVSVQPENLSRNLVETEEHTQMSNASDQFEDNVTVGVLVEKEEAKDQPEDLSSALGSEEENKQSFQTHDPTVRGFDEGEPKCSVAESDSKGDGKKCVGSSESTELDSEAPPETINSVAVAIEASSIPSNSLDSKESNPEESKGVEDV